MGCDGTDDDRCPYIERSTEIWVFKGVPAVNSHSLPYYYSDLKLIARCTCWATVMSYTIMVSLMCYI